MDVKTIQLTEEVLNLPMKERAWLASKIINSLGAPPTLVKSKAELIKTVSRRKAEVLTGSVKTIPVESTVNRLLKKFHA
ncbi:MAG: addiction module protein [Verrucomicrobiota bacterium]|nr:addiction module protein [Verrucomicrobiota bacterium]